MTVGAVNSVTSYSSFYQAQFFAGTVSSDRLKDLMKEYGVQTTGNEYNDLQSLYQAMYRYFSQYGVPSASEQPSQAQQAATAPWAPLMTQVGLTATGDLNADYATFTDRINYLQGNPSSSESEKASLQEAENAAPSVFVQQSPTQNAGLSGADIVAQLNRAFLIGI